MDRLERFVAVTILTWSGLGTYLLISTTQDAATTVTLPGWVPFWPVLTLPYLCMLAAGWLLPMAISSPERFRACLVAALIAFLLVASIWILYPTKIERPPIPGGWWSAPYRIMVEADPPRCILPSAHGIGATAALWFIGLERPRWRWTLAAALALGSCSIAVVGQHRPMDILIGLAVSALGICIGQALCAGDPEHPPQPAAPPTSRCTTTSRAQRLHSRRASR